MHLNSNVSSEILHSVQDDIVARAEYSFAFSLDGLYDSSTQSGGSRPVLYDANLVIGQGIQLIYRRSIAVSNESMRRLSVSIFSVNLPRAASTEKENPHTGGFDTMIRGGLEPHPLIKSR